MEIDLPPEVLNAALRLSLEMGEAMRKPIDARLRERFPRLTAFKWIERVHQEAETRQNLVEEPGNVFRLPGVLRSTRRG